MPTISVACVISSNHLLLRFVVFIVESPPVKIYVPIDSTHQILTGDFLFLKARFCWLQECLMFFGLMRLDFFVWLLVFNRFFLSYGKQRYKLCCELYGLLYFINCRHAVNKNQLQAKRRPSVSCLDLLISYLFHLNDLVFQ